MAEIVGLAASIIALGSAADAAYRIQKRIRCLARDLRAAQENILKFATEIEGFYLDVTTANVSLHEFSRKSSAENKVFRHIQHHDVIGRIVKASNCLMKYIKKLLPRLRSLESSIPLLERWKWVLRRAEVKALGPKMESIKSSLQLIVSAVTLESVLSQSKSRDNRRLVKRLNRQIVHQRQHIAELEEKLRHAHVQGPESHDEEFFELQSGVQEIIDLSEIMVDHGSVPDPEEYFGSSSTSSVIGFPDGSDVPHPSPSNSQSSRSSGVRSWPERTEISTTPATSPITSLATTVEPQEMGVRPLELRQERRRIPSRHRQEESSPISEIVLSSHEPSTRASPVKQEEAGPSSRSDGDFIAVREKSYLLHLNSALEQAKPTPGYIHTGTRTIFVTALLDAALNYNVISLAQVLEWGLELEPADDEDPVWLQFANGEEWKSCGTVIFTWSKGVAHLKPFRVQCLVFEHNIRELIFGNPFLERRKHYWRRHDGVEVEESKV